VSTEVDHAGSVSDELDLAIVVRRSCSWLRHAVTFRPKRCMRSSSASKLRSRNLLYASDKVASARSLERTSAPIVHAGGTYDSPKQPPPTGLRGRLSLISDFNGFEARRAAESGFARGAFDHVARFKVARMERAAQEQTAADRLVRNAGLKAWMRTASS
jgi:hypothetical protein